MSYAGLADENGYIIIGSRKVHVEMLRDVDPEHIAGITGVPLEWLREQARGAWAPLGLGWDDA